MRSLKEFIKGREPNSQGPLIDDKTVFYVFRKIIREEYGLRGVTELDPAGFSDGILSIKANNPLYSSELWIRREIIIGRINTTLEQAVVQEIHLVRYLR